MSRIRRRWEIPVDENVNLDEFFNQNKNEDVEFVEEKDVEFKEFPEEFREQRNKFDRRICISVRITTYDDNELIKQRVEELKRLIQEKFVVLTESFGFPRKRRKSSKTMIYLTIVHKDDYELLEKLFNEIENKIKQFKSK